MLQGFQVSDDEINMDLTNFKHHYANSGGSVECVGDTLSKFRNVFKHVIVQSQPTEFLHEPPQ